MPRACPSACCLRPITKARELFAAGKELATDRALRRVVDLPVDLDVFEPSERRP